MAGVKGRSGGPRPGSGRPRTKRVEPTVPVSQDGKDMLEFLIDVALGKTDATALQVRAAVAAVQYTHIKTHDGGKKDERARQAEEAASGRFGAGQTPLRVVNGGR